MRSRRVHTGSYFGWAEIGSGRASREKRENFAIQRRPSPPPSVGEALLAGVPFPRPIYLHSCLYLTLTHLFAAGRAPSVGELSGTQIGGSF